MRIRAVEGKVRNIQGWRCSRPDHRDKLMAAPPEATVLPPSIDLAKKCPPVRDQGALGSCTANAVLAAMGFLYTRNAKTDPQLSRLFTYYYTRKIGGSGPSEDAGAALRDAMKCLTAYGSCYESTWPYAEREFSTEPPHRAVMEARDHQAQLYYRCPSLRSVKASIAQGFPVVGGFSCPKTMFDASVRKTGIVPYPTPTEPMNGGHAVLFMGYDDKTKRLKFQNSWGTDWGVKGFGFLPYTFVTAGLADDFWTLRRGEL